MCRVWSHVGKFYWGEFERKKCLFETLFCVFVVIVVVIVVLPVRAGQDRGVDGLERQNDEDIC